MADLISVDLGKTGAIAYWEKGKCYRVAQWKIGKKELNVEHLSNVVKIFQEAIGENKPIVVVERPSMRLPYQWILYSDLRYLAKINKCEFYAYMPTTIKKEVTGSGKADKEDMKKALLKNDILSNGVLPNGEHEIDSILAGWCYLRKTHGK